MMLDVEMKLLITRELVFLNYTPRLSHGQSSLRWSDHFEDSILKTFEAHNVLMGTNRSQPVPCQYL